MLTSFDRVSVRKATCQGTLLLLLLCATQRAGYTADRPDPTRWEDDIQQMEATEKSKPVPQQGIVFVGSSSIRMWKLAKWFPDLPVTNRGFGGSHLADSVHYADRLVLKHKPKTVVLYAGDNDIQNGLTPQQVVDDYRKFVAVVHAALPDTRIIYVPIKPSLQRWEKYPAMSQANQMIRELTEASEFQSYLPIEPPMLDNAGKPRPEIFQQDGLHLNENGYAIWAELLRPLLK